MAVEIVGVAANSYDSDQRFDRRIDAAGPVLDEIVDVDEIGPARLAQRVNDWRAFRIDEVLSACLGQHERLRIVEHLKLKACVARLIDIFFERSVAEFWRADQRLAFHRRQRRL